MYSGRDEQQTVTRLQMITRVLKLAQTVHKENEERKVLIKEVLGTGGTGGCLALAPLQDGLGDGGELLVRHPLERKRLA